MKNQYEMYKKRGEKNNPNKNNQLKMVGCEQEVEDENECIGSHENINTSILRILNDYTNI